MHGLEDIPEDYEGVLDCTSLAICCSFNRRGSLLAVGCNDGNIVIWDFLTRGIAKIIPGSTNNLICSISWSRDGHKLVSASLDNTVAVWHVLSGKCLMRWKFPSPILKAQLNPRNDKLVLVSPLKHSPIIIEINYNDKSINYKTVPLDPEDNDPSIVATFDRRGQYIYTGNTKGRIALVACPSTLNGDESKTILKIVSSFKIQTTGSTPAAVKEIEFGARNKTFFLVNSSDRTMRLYDCNSALNAGVNGWCSEVRKYQDLVNKTMWRRCCLSSDRDASYVCGGSSRQHALYIWQRDNDSVVKKILQGTKGEYLLDIQWHPIRPNLASISSGLISVWAPPQVVNWSAFAPDFRELEECIEYDERESEFDSEDEDNHRICMKQESDMDMIDEVDVTNVDLERGMMSSDEEEIDANALEIIPMNLNDWDSANATMHEVEQLPATTSMNDQAKEEGAKEDEGTITIDIILENPPVDEIHPLAIGATKRIRFSEKTIGGKKVARIV